MKMKMLSLFSGIGGIDLAAQWAGIDTVAFCEKDKFCQKVLAKHWPNVPCFDDVKKPMNRFRKKARTMESIRKKILAVRNKPGAVIMLTDILFKN